MNVNSISHFWTVKAFLPAMIESNHGHIVTIASLAGINSILFSSNFILSLSSSTCEEDHIFI